MPNHRRLVVAPQHLNLFPRDELEGLGIILSVLLWVMQGTIVPVSETQENALRALHAALQSA
ncbi:hypothetical protein D3C83_213450 [compost metagenome]